MVFTLSLVSDNAFHADVVHAFREGYLDLIVRAGGVIDYTSGVDVGEFDDHVGYAGVFETFRQGRGECEFGGIDCFVVVRT